MARAASRSVSVSSARQQRTGKVSGSRAFDLPLDTAPMEARLTDTLPAGEGWQYEPKWDGFRCLAFKAGDAVELRAKSGKSLARYFPEVVMLLRGLSAPRFVVDGELLIGADGAYSFDALQMRLHPAESRIRQLSIEIPARLMLFDMLIDADGNRVMDAPLLQRRQALEAYASAQAHDRLCLSRYTRNRGQASRWLEDAAEGTDGVVAKRLDEPYVPGEREMVKVKRVRTAECVVGGFRYAAHSREVGSLLLGLYDRDGKLNHVGYTSSIKSADRAALTRKLEALAAPPGFTGRAPGGPSRWSTERSGEWQPVRPQLVVEVRFDHVTNERFRHGTGFVRWRPDKSPRQCTMEQIAPGR
jgi:ATP-dependent DNA ligase